MGRLIIFFAIAFIIWAVPTIGFIFYAEFLPDSDLPDATPQIIQTWINLSSGAWSFIAPFLKLLILIYIAFEIAKYLGFSRDYFSNKREGKSDIFFDGPNANIKSEIYKEILTSERVQSILALSIVGSLCVSALAGLSGTNLLKDLELVVVGFYFGTRTKRGEEVAWLTLNQDGKFKKNENQNPEGSASEAPENMD